MGPWNHGGWRNPARAMAVVDPGTSDGYLRDVEAPWFAYWLHDRGKLSQAEAYLYDAGVKQWRAFDQWPPAKSSTQRKLYMHADGKLSFDAPRARRSGVRPVHLRPGTPSSVPRATDRADIRSARLELANVGDARPTFRARSAGRAELDVGPVGERRRRSPATSSRISSRRRRARTPTGS